MRREPLLHPAAAADAYEHEHGGEGERTNEQRDRERACRRVGGRRQDAARGRRIRRPERGGHCELLLGRADSPKRDTQADVVAGPCGRVVADAPRAVELGRDRGVDLRECSARSGAVVGAVRAVGERLQGGRVEVRPLDPDRVDGRSRPARRRDGRVERGVTRDVAAVREHDDHTAGEWARAQRQRGLDDRVVERGARAAGDCERTEHSFCLGRRRREPGELHGAIAECDHRDPVGRVFAMHERTRGGLRVRERLTGHRARVVDRDHEALRVAQVDGVEAAHRHAVLGQARRLRRVRLRDDVEDDVGVAGGVDPGDSQRRARRCRCRRGEDRKGGSRRGGRKCGGPPHWNAPSKLVGEKADRGASASSSTPKKLCGSTTPF